MSPVLTLSFFTLSTSPLKNSEYFQRVVLSSLLFRLLQSLLPSEIQLLKLFLLQQFIQSSIKEHEFPDDVSDVKLHRHLLTTFVIEICPGPVRFVLALAEDSLEHHAEVVEQVERARRYFLLVVVQHDLPGDADLVGLLGVELHYEDQPYYGADQPTHVREVRINLVEAPLVGGSFWRLSKKNLNKRFSRISHKVGGCKLVSNSDNFFLLNLLIRHQTQISFDDILRYFSKSQGS